MKRYRQTTLNLQVQKRKKIFKDHEVPQVSGILCMNDDCIGVIMAYLGPGEIHRISKIHSIIERISFQDFMWKDVYKDVKNHHVGRKVYDAQTTELLDEAKTARDNALNTLYKFNVDIYTKKPSYYLFSTFIDNFVDVNHMRTEQSLDLAIALYQASFLGMVYSDIIRSSTENEMWFVNHRERAMYIMKERCKKCNKSLFNNNNIKTCYDYGKSCRDNDCIMSLLCTSCTCNNKCNICGFYMIDDDDGSTMYPPFKCTSCSDCSKVMHINCNDILDPFNSLCNTCLILF
jgi:hypothetical protein